MSLIIKIINTNPHSDTYLRGGGQCTWLLGVESCLVHLGDGQHEFYIIIYYYFVLSVSKKKNCFSYIIFQFNTNCSQVLISLMYKISCFYVLIKSNR